MFAPPLYIPSIASRENPVKSFCGQKKKMRPYNQSFVICRSEILIARLTVEEKNPMPSDTLAIPWTKFPKWLKSKLKTLPFELRNHWSGEVSKKTYKG